MSKVKTPMTSCHFLKFSWKGDMCHFYVINKVWLQKSFQNMSRTSISFTVAPAPSDGYCCYVCTPRNIDVDFGPVSSSRYQCDADVDSKVEILLKKMVKGEYGWCLVCCMRLLKRHGFKSSSVTQLQSGYQRAVFTLNK